MAPLQISLLRVADGGRVRSVADVVGSVEPIPGVGNVLFVSGMQHAGRERPASCMLHIIAARPQP